MAARRDPSLVPLSHDHHHGLVRVFRIRKALREGGDARAEAETTRAFYESDLRPHFQAEEEALVPALRDAQAVDDGAIARLFAEHRELDSRATDLQGDPSTLAAFADLLEAHIRFEERELFPAYEARVPTERRRQVEADLRRALRRPA